MSAPSIKRRQMYVCLKLYAVRGWPFSVDTKRLLVSEIVRIKKTRRFTRKAWLPGCNILSRSGRHSLAQDYGFFKSDGLDMASSLKTLLPSGTGTMACSACSSVTPAGGCPTKTAAMTGFFAVRVYVPLLPSLKSAVKDESLANCFHAEVNCAFALTSRFFLNVSCALYCDKTTSPTVIRKSCAPR